ncbi:MAG: hypothetical protein K1W24_13400 [Lachnospiraceae bacterium]
MRGSSYQNKEDIIRLTKKLHEASQSDIGTYADIMRESEIVFQEGSALLCLMAGKLLQITL